MRLTYLTLDSGLNRLWAQLCMDLILEFQLPKVKDLQLPEVKGHRCRVTGLVRKVWTHNI